MHLQPGDRVRIQGLNDEIGVARVVRVDPDRLVITTEEEYEKAKLSGREPLHRLRWPYEDVLGLADPPR